jgi:4-hydroxy-2-oxoglutarate aldolase
MNLTGVFAPVPTPFDEQDRVDVERLRAAFTRWLASPLTGFVILGSNGEAALLDEQESEQVIAEARAVVPRNRPFIVGTGRESTKATIVATQRAATLGADAVLVRTPGFFKSQMTADAFDRHYRSIADASPVPVLLYNFTAVTGVNLAPAVASSLASHPNIIGMKESGGDIGQMSALVDGTPEDFQVLAGSATTFYASLCVGAVGGILALGCVLPEACVRLFQLVREGHNEEARAQQRTLVSLARLLGSFHGVAGLKAALDLVGIDVGWPRPPLLPVNETIRATLRGELAKIQEVLA